MKEVKTNQEKEEFPREFSIAFKRWLVREIRGGRMTTGQAVERFELHSNNPAKCIRNWLHRYSGDLEVSLPVMSEKERIKLEELQKRIKALEKQLEHAQMKNIALETLIDVAEESLKVPIRKKAGAKQ